MINVILNLERTAKYHHIGPLRGPYPSPLRGSGFSALAATPRFARRRGSPIVVLAASRLTFSIFSQNLHISENLHMLNSGIVFPTPENLYNVVFRP